MSTDTIQQLITALPDVDAPAGFASAIEARLARASTQQTAQKVPTWQGWLALLTGGLGALWVQLHVLLSDEVETERVASVLPRWTEQVAALGEFNLASLALTVGLLVYCAGLFRLGRN